MESHLILVFISTVLVTAVLGQGVHLELKGTVIPNNSVVEYSDIGTNTIITLRCVTERVDCCSADNSTRANWFTPSGEVADRQFSRIWSGLGRAKGYVYILRRSSIDIADVQEGLYHCIIPAPNDDTSTLYVGIYTGINTNIGRPTISGITYNQLGPEMFTLTCTSTGGPATTVIWTLDGSEITYDANHVLTQTVINTITAEYNNTLTVTGREPGNYQCTVSNTRGSDTSQLHNTGGTTITPVPSPCLSPTHQSMTAKPSITVMLPSPSSSSSVILIPTTTSDNQNPSSSSQPQETATPTTTENNQNPCTCSPQPEMSMTFTSTIVVSVMAAVLLVVTVVLSVAIVLLVLRLRHLSASLLNNPGVEMMVSGSGAIPVEECVAYESHRGKGRGGGGGGGGGAIYSEPEYVISEQPVQEKTVLSSTTEETVYERLD